MELLVVGWVRDVPPIDSGVPEIVKDILSRALTREHSLTFIDPDQTKLEEWQRTPDGWLLYLRAAGWRGRLTGRGFGLRCTADSQVAGRLFDTQYSLWDSERQMVLLTPPKNSPPRVNYESFENLFRPEGLDWNELWQTTGAEGVLMPGPDGDFAQLISGRDIFQRISAHLEEEARAARVEFESVSEADFEQTKWFLQEVGG